MQDRKIDIITTHPENILRHSISDEELEMLQEKTTDFVVELLLLSLGAVVGTLPVALSSMLAYLSTPDGDFANLSLIEFVQIVLFWVGVSLSVSLGFIYNKKSKRAAMLKDNIRSRSIKAVS